MMEITSENKYHIVSYIIWHENCADSALVSNVDGTWVII